MEGATFTIRIDGDATGFACRADQSVLAAMRDAGRTLLTVGCRSGGCGVCRVRVLAGHYETRVMSAAEVTPEQAREGHALACRVLPRSDLTLVSAPRPRAAQTTALAA